MNAELKIWVLTRDGRGRTAPGPADLEGVGAGDRIMLKGRPAEIPAATAMMVGLAALRGADVTWGGAL